jgi:O-antigen ligase
MALGALIGALAWGAFAFGAYYPWAYWPMVAVALMVALTGLLARFPVPRLGLSALAASFAIFMVAGLVQLIPLPIETLRSISPETPGVISQLDLVVAQGLVTTHPLSIAPRKTLIGLAVVGSLGFLAIGGARLFSIVGVRRIAKAITILGVLLALEGIVQRPLSSKVYGFWDPSQGGNPFGPFVNKNHFAGWMLMALPLTLGLIGGSFARGMRGSVSGLRDRVLWLSSPEGLRVLFWIGAAALMGLSLILTMSRSAMAVAVLVVTAVAIRALKSEGTTTPRRIAAAAIVCLAAAGVVAWIGPGMIAARFGEATWDQVNERRGAWLDAIGITRRYPVTGTGFNTYGVASLFYQQHNLTKHFFQAHNDYLQLAAEGGLLLCVPAVACLVLLARVIRRRFDEETSVFTSWIRFGAVTGMAAVALQDTVEFSLQMPGNALLFAVLCAIALHRTPLRHRPAQLSSVK